MSHLNSVWIELHGAENRHETPGRRRLGVLAAVALLTFAAVCGLAEITYLPSFAADDFGAILFGAG